MKLLLGTTNPAKIEDYKKYLTHPNLKLVTPHDIGFMDEPLETGKTFFDNALLKAKFYAERTEYATLSEDGGFVVDALDGRPGIESNRWLGPNATDLDKIEKILELLDGVPQKERTARLAAVAVVYFPDVRDYVSDEGAEEGIILDRYSKTLVPKFPYRSLLFIEKFQKFYSDLSDQELDEIDHRKTLCQHLILKITPYLNS